MQRISGALLIPTSIWMLFFVIPAVSDIIFSESEIQNQALEKIFGSIYSASTLIMFLLCSLYHGMLGIKSAINDYIHCDAGKKIAIFLLVAISFTTSVFGCVFILNSHINTISTQNNGDIAVISETIVPGEEQEENNEDIKE